MSDDRSDLEEAIRLLRIMRHGEQNPGPAFGCVSPQQRANVDAFLLRHPEKPKLLPCPFCGREAPKIVKTAVWRVFCELCWSSSTVYEMEADAIAAWNRRATPVGGPLSGGKPE